MKKFIGEKKILLHSLQFLEQEIKSKNRLIRLTVALYDAYISTEWRNPSRQMITVKMHNCLDI